MAWQQDIDLYATANYSMIAALELHARIINAGGCCGSLCHVCAAVATMPSE